MTTGPGPKEPPFITHAVQTVEQALGLVAQSPAPLVVPPTPPLAVPPAIAATIGAALDKAHAAEREALDKAHALEVNAASALDHIWSHVDRLVQRFPNAAPAKDQLEAAFRNFASAIGG